MDTSGFYKKLEDDSWLYAPNFVYSSNYTLERDGNRWPIDGWEWYENEPVEYTIWKLKNNEDTPAN